MTDKNSSLHVCYILKRYPRLSETFIVNEIQELQRQGIQVTILAQKNADEPVVHEAVRRLNVPVYYLPPPSAIPRKNWALRFLPSFYEQALVIAPDELRGNATAEDHMAMIQASLVAPFLQHLGVNHIHAHFATWATSMASAVSKLTGIPYSFTAHAKDIYHESVDTKLLVEKIAHARFVITVSDFNKNYLENILTSHGRQGRIIRLYNGIDLTRFSPVSGEKELQLIMGVGRLVEKKGFDDLIDACHILKNRNQPFHCIIVGEGQERMVMEKRIAEFSLEKEISLLGAKPQEDVIGLLRRATMFVLPCKIGNDGNRDGLPTVIIEAMALGTPVISTRIVGIPEMIDHEQNGILVNEKDPEGLADAINLLLDAKDRRTQFSEAAVIKAQRDFDLTKNVTVLKDYFLSQEVRHVA